MSGSKRTLTHDAVLESKMAQTGAPQHVQSLRRSSHERVPVQVEGGIEHGPYSRQSLESGDGVVVQRVGGARNNLRSHGSVPRM